MGDGKMEKVVSRMVVVLGCGYICVVEYKLIIYYYYKNYEISKAII